MHTSNLNALVAGNLSCLLEAEGIGLNCQTFIF